MERGDGGRGSRDARGVMWAAASALSFSLSSVVGKDLLDALGVPSLLFWRFTVASAVIWAILLLRPGKHGASLSNNVRARLFGLGVLLGLVVLVGFEGLERLDVSVYIVLVYLYPALVVVMSATLGARPRNLTWVALALTIGGVVLTVPEIFSGVETISVTGVLLSLAQAVLFAGYMVLSNRVVPGGIDGLVSAGWTNLGTVLFFVPFALIGGLVTPDSRRLVAEVAFFALIPTVAALTCMFTALRLAAPGLVAMVMTVEVVFAIAWSVMFLGERPSPVAYLGAAVVVAGVLLAQWDGQRSTGLADPSISPVPSLAD